MSRRLFDADWERTKKYLIRSMFADTPALSPIPESEISRASSPDDVIPLPELIIEKMPKRRHDEPEEYYDHLQKRMRKFYRKLFNKPDGDSSGTEFDVTIYDQDYPVHPDFVDDHVDLNVATSVPDANLHDDVNEPPAVPEIETSPKDLVAGREQTQPPIITSHESIESGREEEPRSSSSSVKEQVEHSVVRAMVHEEATRESYVFPVHKQDVKEKDNFEDPRRIVSTPSTTSLSQSGQNIEIPVIMTEITERNENESPRQRAISPSVSRPNQSLEPIEPGFRDQERIEVENSSLSENIRIEYDITSPDEEVEGNKTQGNDDKENVPGENEREEFDQCRETEATDNESLNNSSDSKTQGSKETNSTQDNDVEPENDEIEEEFEEEIGEEEGQQETVVCSEETSEVREEGAKDSDEFGEELDANDDTATERVTKSSKGLSEEAVGNIEIIVTETENRTSVEPMDEIEVMRSHDPSSSGSLQHHGTQNSSNEEINIELQHSFVRDAVESNSSAFEEFSPAADVSDDLHPLLRTSTPTQETKRALKRCSSEPTTDDSRKRQRFRDLVTQIAKDLKRKRHIEVQTDRFDTINEETQTDNQRDSRDERPPADEQVIGVDAGCQTERDEERERDSEDGGDETNGSESETEEQDERDGPTRYVFKINMYFENLNFYV